MQMQSVETSAGTAICAAPSRIACAGRCPSSRLRSMFSIVTVASSTRMPTASARPPSVMMLMVSPRKLSTMTEVRIESGIETAMIRVLRQLPRKSRIIRPVRQAAMIASRITPLIAAAHEDRLVRERLDLQLRRQRGRHARQQPRMPVDDVQGGGVARLEHGEQHAAPAVAAARCWSAARSRRRTFATSRR